jgi:hypothetical protein
MKTIAARVAVGVVGLNVVCIKDVGYGFRERARDT